MADARQELRAAVDKAMQELYPILKADSSTYVDAEPFKARLTRAQELFPESSLAKFKPWRDPTISPVDLNHLFSALSGLIQLQMQTKEEREAARELHRKMFPD
jgi:hypothetical protein